MPYKRCSGCRKPQSLSSFVKGEESPEGWRRFVVREMPWSYYRPKYIDEVSYKEKRKQVGGPHILTYTVFYLCDQCTVDAELQERQLKDEAYKKWIDWLDSPEAQPLMEKMDDVSKTIYRWLREHEGREVRVDHLHPEGGSPISRVGAIEKPKRRYGSTLVWELPGGELELDLEKPSNLKTKVETHDKGIRYSIGYKYERDAHGDIYCIRGASYAEQPDF